MYCGKCGNQLEAGAAFCPNCGTAVEESNQAFHYQVIDGGKSSEAPKGNQTTNAHLEKAKHISKGYFGFFMEHVKAPIRHGFSVDKNQWVNGLITLIIFALFLGFSSYFVARSLAGGFEFFGFGRRVSVMDSLILPLLYMAFTLAIIIGLIFVVAKMMKSEATFQDIVARFGTFMLIPSLFMVLSFVFGFLKLYSLVGIVSFGYLLSLICAIVLTVYSYSREQRGGIDAYYGILLTFLGLAFAFYLFGENMLGGFYNLY